MRVAILNWGVKQSFRSYVEMSGGEIAVGAGAQRTPDGAFAFEAAPDSALEIDGGALAGTGRFRGEVSFQAHGGMLSVKLIDPWLEPTADGLVLTIAETPTRRTAIARLNLGAQTTEPDGTVAIPAVTTMDGMMILGDHYPPGTALDPVRLAGAR